MAVNTEALNEPGFTPTPDLVKTQLKLEDRPLVSFRDYLVTSFFDGAPRLGTLVQNIDFYLFNTTKLILRSG